MGSFFAARWTPASASWDKGAATLIFSMTLLRRYALVAADASASRSILVFKHDLDKVHSVLYGHYSL